MKLLVYRWNAWNQKDVEESLSALGHELTFLSISPQNPEEDFEFVEAVVAQGKLGLTQALFSINYFPVLAEAGHLLQIPYICWNCDGSLLAMYHESVFYDTNYIFTFDRFCKNQFQELGVSHIWHMPLGVNARRLHNLPSHETDAYDISFVGSLYEKNSFDGIENKLPSYLAGYFDAALLAQQNVSGGNLLEAMLTPKICQQLEDITNYHRCERSFVSIKQLFSSTVLGFKSANLQRCKILNTLSKSGKAWSIPAQVHLFTTDKADELPFVTVHPPVDYFQEMPLIFQNSKININSTIPTIPTGIPLRIWDILGCGGFLLTDYREELMDYFQSGKHLSIYEDTEELLEKAEFYFEQDELRKKIAKTSREIVLKNHTWDNRLTKMFQRIKTAM